MKTLYRPYETAEFRQTVDATIFDMEADLEREHRSQLEATYMFRRHKEREASVQLARAILSCIGFVVGFAVLLYVGWSWL